MARARIQDKETVLTDKEKDLGISGYLNTGIDLLDCVLGKGLPLGQSINICGEEGGGKTYLVCEILANLRKKYGDKLKWFYDFPEARFDSYFNELYKFEILPNDPLLHKRSFTMDDFKRNVNNHLSKIKNDEIGVYIVDCFDALTTEEELFRIKEKLSKAEEKDYNNAENLLEAIKKVKGSFRGEKPKEVGEFFRFLAQAIRGKQYLLIIISQVRMNMDMYGPKFNRNGGKALDHMCSQIMWLRVSEVHYAAKSGIRKRAIRNTVNIKITKNSAGKPFRESYIDYLYDYGVDNIISNINFLYELKTDTGKSKEKVGNLGWKDKVFTTVKDLVQYIEGNNEEEELSKAVIKKWNEVETAIAPMRKERF